MLETPLLRFSVSPETGAYEMLDKQTKVIWRSNPFQARFGEVTVRTEGKSQTFALGKCTVTQNGQKLGIAFKPNPGQPEETLVAEVEVLPGQNSLSFNYRAEGGLVVENVRLLDEALWVSDADNGYVVVPVREGLLVPANSQLAFKQRFDTFAYEGCHMEMFGVVKEGSAVLVTWHDPYVALDLKSELKSGVAPSANQILSPSLVLRESARSFRLHFRGAGDYVTLAQAYRPIAKEKGWLVTWDDKLKKYPSDAKLFGAINFKLWSTLSRQMSEDSQTEKSARVEWTFDEAAQVAEHLSQDLKLEKVLFIIGGWIRRGYDNQHPDILPAAPECGGDEGLADCSRRVNQLGYLFCLHDNYQDIYRDSPSWNEKYIMKNRDGSLCKGGHWAGGLAYLTCSKMALELAMRPQNLGAVKKLTDAPSYFIDTTYASGLQECFDPEHPLTRWDDMKWKQALSDNSREVFGQFGSECGREWAIPHSDFFEGFTGVSGTYYHNAALPANLGAQVIPLFELVYRDTIAMYGKYGYDIQQASEYVLHHILIGRPLNYHSIPAHLYWKRPESERTRGGLRIALAQPVVEAAGPRQFRITYQWQVEEAPKADWRVFAHFTDADGNIKFQNDFEPATPTSKWKAGQTAQGPFTVTVPEGLTGTFDIRIGLFQEANDTRARLTGTDDGERRYLVGKVKVSGDRVEFDSAVSTPARPAADPGLFVRGDQGWTDGLHPMDRFVKNTYEILSPLNEITSRMRMTGHQFLTADRKVQRGVYGEGAKSVEVVVNLGKSGFEYPSRKHGLVKLPPYGFLVESPDFVAFHASNWNGLAYEKPVMFALRSQDGKSLAASKKVRVYHGFGDPRIQVGGREYSIIKESTVTR